MGVIRETHIVYTVRPGDTLYSIAAQFGSTVEAIVRANAVYPPITDPYLIYPGTVLLIPAPHMQPYRTIYIVAPGDTLYRIALRFSAHLDLMAGINRGIRDPNFIPVGQPLWVPAFTYEISSGDTLARIARHFQIPLNAVLYANEGRAGFSPDVIYPGYRLIIPLPSSRNIVVIRPLPADTVSSGFMAEGFARAFEGNVLLQVRDNNDVVVSGERATTATEGGPAYGYFFARLPFDRQPTTRTGELWVYTRSPRDGSITDLVQVKVGF